MVWKLYAKEIIQNVSVPTYVSIIANAYPAHLSPRWVPPPMNERLDERPIWEFPPLDGGEADAGRWRSGRGILDLGFQLPVLGAVWPEPFLHSLSWKHTASEKIKDILMVWKCVQICGNYNTNPKQF